MPTKSVHRLTFIIFAPTVPERIPLELRYGRLLSPSRFVVILDGFLLSLHQPNPTRL